jgi:hypothetical protein
VISISGIAGDPSAFEQPVSHAGPPPQLLQQLNGLICGRHRLQDGLHRLVVQAHRIRRLPIPSRVLLGPRLSFKGFLIESQVKLLRTLDSLIHVDDLDEIRGHLRYGAALPHISLELIGILILLGIVL